MEVGAIQITRTKRGFNQKLREVSVTTFFVSLRGGGAWPLERAWLKPQAAAPSSMGNGQVTGTAGGSPDGGGVNLTNPNRTVIQGGSRP
jgi:hypothetical protein